MFRKRLGFSLSIILLVLGLLSCISKTQTIAVAATKLISQNRTWLTREDIVKYHIRSYVRRWEMYSLCDSPSCMNTTYTKDPNMIDETLCCFDDSGNCVSETRAEFLGKDTFMTVQTNSQYDEKGKLVHRLEHVVYYNRGWGETKMKILDTTYNDKEQFFSKYYDIETNVDKRTDTTYFSRDSTVYDDSGKYVGIYNKRGNDWKQTYEWRYDSLSRMTYEKHVEDYDGIKTTITTTTYSPDGSSESIEQEFPPYTNPDPQMTTKRKYDKKNNYACTWTIAGRGASAPCMVDSLFYDNFGNLLSEIRYDDQLVFTDRTEVEYDFANDRISKRKHFSPTDYNEDFYVYKTDASGSTIESWNYHVSHAVKPNYNSYKSATNLQGASLTNRTKFDASGKPAEISYYVKGHTSSRIFYAYTIYN